MKQVGEYIFVGDTVDALSKERMETFHIESVVCAARDHPMPFQSSVSYAYYPLLDDDTDNVLLYVDPFSAFIEDQVSHKRNTLVHCVQGVSRSVALIVSYFMLRDKTAFREVYDQLKQVYPQASISDNFVQQLTDLGEKFHWSMQLDSQAHRIFRSSIWRKGIIESERNIVGEINCTKAVGHGTRYICRKCRFCLFLDTHVIPSTNANLEVECMQWMMTSMTIKSQASGDILCPSCTQKVGNFNWHAKEYPLFVMVKSKLDEMPLNCSYKGDGFPKTQF